MTNDLYAHHLTNQMMKSWIKKNKHNKSNLIGLNETNEASLGEVFGSFKVDNIMRTKDRILGID